MKNSFLYKVLLANRGKATVVFLVTAVILATVSMGEIQKKTVGGEAYLSNEEIQNFIEKALIKGCRPVRDVCDSECGSKEVDLSDVPMECRKPVLRVSTDRSEENYIKLARKHGIKGFNMDEWPKQIRESLEKQGKPVEEYKQKLSI